MNRYQRHKRRGIQDAATLLLCLVGVGWLIGGWRVFVTDPAGRELMPYVCLSAACISLAISVVANWRHFVSGPSRRAIVVYFVSLAGMVAASLMSLAGTNDVAGLAMPLLLLLHSATQWAVRWQLTNSAAR